MENKHAFFPVHIMFSQIWLA